MELRSGFGYLGTCDPLFKCLLNLEVETPTLSLHFGLLSVPPHLSSHSSTLVGMTVTLM